MSSEAPDAPRYSAAGAALHALLHEVAALPRGGPGLAVGQAALLHALAGRAPCTVAALARSGAVPAATRQGVQRGVDALVRQGLAEKRPNPRHRRAPCIVLTEAGRRRARRAAREEAARLNARAEALDPAALRAAARVLRSLRAAAEPTGPSLRAAAEPTGPSLRAAAEPTGPSLRAAAEPPHDAGRSPRSPGR